MVALVGEGGIGKTRLAERVASVSRQVGLSVVTGCCPDGDGAPSYWPWIEALKGLPLEQGDDTASIEALAGSQSTMKRPDRTPLLPGGDQSRMYLFDALLSVVARIASRAPLLIVLEDLHWADTASIALLQFVARRLGGLRILVLVTYRDTELRRGSRLAESLAAVPGRRLPVAGLNLEAVGELAAHLVGHVLDPATVVRIFQRTEGNPFFIGELLGLLAGDVGQFDCSCEGDPWHVPDGAAALVARRLRLLSPGLGRTLQEAAGIGRSFTLRLLERVSGLSGECVLALMEEALEARIVTRMPDTVGHYAFSHELIRAVLYESLGPAARVRLHRSIAEGLENLCWGNDQSCVTEIAHHYYEAAHDGNVGPAIAYAHRAAERAERVLAYEEAADQYQRVLRLIGAGSIAGEPTRHGVFLRLGDTLAKAGRYGDANEAFRRAVEASRDVADWESFGRSTLGLAGQWASIGRADWSLIRLLREAIDRLGPNDSVLRARLLSRLACEFYWTDRVDERQSLSSDAVGVARRLGDPVTLAEVVSRRRHVLWAPENVGDRLSMANDVVHSAEAAGHRELMLMGRIWRAVDLIELGKVASVPSEVESCVQLAQDLRQPYFLHMALALQAAWALHCGHLEQAERLAQATHVIGVKAAIESSDATWLNLMLSIRRDQGCLSEILETCTLLTERHPTLVGWRCALAYCYAELGMIREGRLVFDRVAVHGFQGVPRDYTWLCAMVLLGEASVRLGFPETVSLLYKNLLPYSDRVATIGIGVSFGAVARVLALLAESGGEWDVAQEHFECAMALHSAIGAGPMLARTQVAYASALVQRTGGANRRRAHELARQALTLATNLGMKNLVREAQIVLGGKDAGDEAASPLVASPLKLELGVFRREGEYWTLIYAGSTTRVKGCRGIEYLETLLRQPDRELLALDLLALGRTDGSSDVRMPVEMGCPAIDGRARDEYQERLRALQDQLDVTMSCGDAARAAELREEMEFLAGELCATLGMRGARQAASASERARTSVTKAVRNAVRRIGVGNAALGRYLGVTIRTGTFCSYQPDPDRAVAWSF